MARYADTLTDGGTWSLEDRLAYLDSWENFILGKIRPDAKWSLNASVGAFRPEEAELLMHGSDLLEAFHALPPRERELGADLLKTLISAMRWDLKNFPAAANGNAVKLGVKDRPLFDWYTYAIAGCVGEYWAKVFQLPTDLEHFATSYGKGLQRINILRDAEDDWKIGRVYFPRADFESRGWLEKCPWTDDVENWKAYRAEYIRDTRELLQRGSYFCDSIPKLQFRLRWASAMPLLIGLKTLDLIEKNSSSKQKITRDVVKKLAAGAWLKVILGQKFTTRGALA